MSTVDTIPAGGQPPVERLRAGWHRLVPETRTEAARTIGLLAVVVVAFHYSLLTLLRSLNLETPLAYLGLVPVMALGLAFARRRPATERAIHDRSIDFIIGVPLLATAAAINLFLPHQLSTFFWIWRIDLLSLPLFVAGAIALLLGTRALWRFRLPLVFLLLAWPLPYSVFLTTYLDRFTELTLSGLRTALDLWHVADPVASGDGSIFRLGSGSTKSFEVSVASACSGVNGVVGFLLVAIAFMALVKGPKALKALWLVLGLFLIWAINVVRIMLIFWAGSRFGETVAIDGLHPYIGLVGFNLGVLGMVLALPRFRLGLDPDAFRRREPVEAEAVAAAARRAVPSAKAAMVVVLVVGLVIASTNAGLRSYDAVAGTLGDPRLTSFTARPTAPQGWNVRRSNVYTWARRFFGDSSTWNRYSLAYTGVGGSALQANRQVTADVINTDDRGRFSAYGVEACYKFHGYKLRGTRTVELGGGVTGTALSYYNPKETADWTAVFWHWPVKVGKKVRYERVTLLIVGTANTASKSTGPLPGASVSKGLGLTGDGKGALVATPAAVDEQLSRNRAFLADFAREVIARQTALAPTKVVQTATKQP